MKLKITEAGWENFNGVLRGCEFVASVSTDDVQPRVAAQIGNIIKVEFVESGKNPSDSQTVLDSNAVPMPVEGQAPAVEVKERFTRAELEAVADKKGIQGLRDLIAANNLSVKGTSIMKLINAILRAGGDKTVPADDEATETTQPAESHETPASTVAPAAAPAAAPAPAPAAVTTPVTPFGPHATTAAPEAGK